MRIVLIRHGEPDYEKDCLTETGHKQAKIAAQRLLKEGIEEIYASPLGRARQTAQYFSEASGIKKIQILDFIQEIRFGREGELYDSKWNPWLGVDALVKAGKDLQTPVWREYPVFKDTFSTTDVDKIAVEADKWLSTLGYEREGKFYRCKRKDDKEKTIAVFCHGGSSTAFMAHVLNQTFPYMCAVLLRYPFTTISILKFDRTPGNLTLPIVELLNDSGHLK
ncbi:MAG: histidine phosphatase family protein [Treponema sp.]|nr:histidine phosphatase family protein [Treponema sp.]